jgi:hypothetical protein
MLWALDPGFQCNETNGGKIRAFFALDAFALFRARFSSRPCALFLASRSQKREKSVGGHLCTQRIIS